MLEIPDTKYAFSGEFAIAYQVIGRGSADILYVPGFAMNVEGNWMLPEHDRFLRRMASFARVLVMDRRGTGCSDRMPPGQTPTLEEIVEDFRAVLRAAHGSHVFLFAVQESAFPAMLAAATHPERFDGLILYSAAPAWRRSDEIPWAWSDERWDDISYPTGENATEFAEAYVRDALPSFREDPASIRRFATLIALTSGPAAALAETRKFSQVDMREVLASIQVPTLVLHRVDDPVEPIESGRFLADRIPDAKLVELPGADALPWVGDGDSVIDEIERFVVGSVEREMTIAPTRTLVSVLFTDIVDSTRRASELGDRAYRELLERHHRAVRNEIRRHRGSEVDTAGDGFFATFEGPARAVECASGIIRAVGELGIDVRAGVHTGEVETIDQKVGGIAVHIGARIASIAGPSEILISSTARDLMAGSGIQLEDAGERELKGLADRWHLYRVLDSARSGEAQP